MSNFDCTSRTSRAGRAFALLAASILLSQPGAARAQTEEESADPDGHAHEHEHEEHDVAETIVVTASPLEHSLDELASPVNRIERDEMLRNLGSTLGETLSRVPGITTTGFAAGASRPVVRGQDAFRSEVLEDGLRTQDVSQESPDHGVPVNPLAARRTEIIRGPATIRYGGGASAGVVNMITNRVPDRIPTDPIAGDVFAGIGLLADERDIAGTLDGSIGDAWHADGDAPPEQLLIPNDSNPHTQSGSQVESYTAFSARPASATSDAWASLHIRAEDRYGIPKRTSPSRSTCRSIDIASRGLDAGDHGYPGDPHASLPTTSTMRSRTTSSARPIATRVDGARAATSRRGPHWRRRFHAAARFAARRWRVLRDDTAMQATCSRSTSDYELDAELDPRRAHERAGPRRSWHPTRSHLVRFRVRPALRPQDWLASASPARSASAPHLVGCSPAAATRRRAPTRSAIPTSTRRPPTPARPA
jgi:hypothetical protein